MGVSGEWERFMVRGVMEARRRWEGTDNVD